MDIIIPEYIYQSVDYEFCVNMIKELHMMFGVSLEIFYEDVFVFLEDTSGWETALISTCRKCSKGMVYQFYKNLGWYESDKFNGWISDRIKEMNLILKGNEKSAVAGFVGKNEDNIEFCMQDNCYYKINSHNVNPNETSIKDKNIKEKITYDIKSIIKSRLNLRDEDFFVCNKCHKHFWNFVKYKDACLYCSMDKKPDSYIQKEIQQNNDFKHYLRI